MDIRVRSSFHDFILKEKRDFDWLVKNQYSSAAQDADRRWIQELRSFQQNEEAKLLSRLNSKGMQVGTWGDPKVREWVPIFGVYPGYYDPQSFISYQIGPSKIVDSGGFVYKVFFEFENPSRDLTPETYLDFSNQLRDAGFEGDSKIPVLNAWARFFYNDIIVHAPTKEAVLIAEKVGLRIFGSKLSGYSRGVDVNNSYSSNQSLDWNNFLCRFDPSTLPLPVFKFFTGTLGNGNQIR